jgi:hypothetical protein
MLIYWVFACLDVNMTQWGWEKPKNSLVSRYFVSESLDVVLISFRCSFQKFQYSGGC